MGERRQRQLTSLRRRMRQHPCHGCAEREQHARWAERWYRLKKQADGLTSQIRGRTGAVAKIFDRVTEVLVELKYLVDDGEDRLSLASTGKMLRRIYGERDFNHVDTWVLAVAFAAWTIGATTIAVVRYRKLQVTR